FMMVRREAVEQIGALDETFFLYGEDIDWCYRIKKRGWKIFYVPTTEIIHFKGESTKRAPRLKSTIAFYKAMYIFVRKHFGSAYLPLPGWLLSLGIALCAIFAVAGKFTERLLLPLADFLLVNLGLWVALLIRFQWVNWPQSQMPSFSTGQWVTVFVVFSSIWLVSFYLIGLYDKYKYHPWRALTGAFVGFVGIIFLVFFLRGYHFSRLVILYSWVINSLLVAGWRGIAWNILKSHKSRRLGRQKALIVGAKENAIHFLNLVRQHPELNYEILGFVENSNHPEEKIIEGVNLLGTIENLPEILKDYKVDEIIVTTQTVPYSQLLSLASDSKSPNVHFKLLPNSFRTIVAQRKIRGREDLPLIDISYSPQWNLKRLWREIFK
ncbi:MAG: glycosyltransferase, partial [Candidatus Latescibacteria bacterium]|nr:glycosyltransferase [Candidatus Latescibacterota bacterium]